MTTFAPLRRSLATALLAGGLLAGVPMTVPAHTLPPAPALSAHEKAISTILLSSRLLPMGRAAIRARPLSDYKREVLDHFVRAHGDEQVTAAYARTIAASITPEQSAAALRVARLPQLRAMMSEVEAAKVQDPTRSVATLNLAKYNDQIEKSLSPEDLRTYWRIIDLAKGMNEFHSTMVSAHEEALAQQLLTLVRAFESASERDDFKMSDLLPSRTGFLLSDRLIDNMAGMFKRLDAVNESSKAAYDKLQLETVLEPKNLVTRAGIERGRAKLARATQVGQEQLLRYQQVYAAEMGRVQAAFKALPGDVHPMIDADVTTSEVTERLGAAADGHQQAFALPRRMLDFAEARIGQSRVVNGKLRFANAADNAAWLALEKEAEASE